MGRITQFYQETITNNSGDRYSDILAWDDEKLEYCHDYIQWLFPLTEPSRAVPNSPVLEAEDIAAFLENEELRAKLRNAFVRMLAFYGLAIQESIEGTQLIEAPNYQERITHLVCHSHNYLRITRILKSLRILGLEAEAQAFFKILQVIYQQEKANIGPYTYAYWLQAVTE
ncbi:MAG: opioid growth factor receptor-related protein [Snowella sp.]|nr:opioid growth factor receptor-related protein [Snowella sp.]